MPYAFIGLLGHVVFYTYRCGFLCGMWKNSTFYSTLWGSISITLFKVTAYKFRKKTCKP